MQSTIGVIVRKTLLIPIAAVAALLPASGSANPTTRADRVNGAKACAELRATMPAGTFRETYGTGPTHANAFGRCVSQWTHTAHQGRHSAAGRLPSRRQAESRVRALRRGADTVSR
jgi:hypothetical protein